MVTSDGVFALAFRAYYKWETNQWNLLLDALQSWYVCNQIWSHKNCQVTTSFEFFWLFMVPWWFLNFWHFLLYIEDSCFQNNIISRGYILALLAILKIVRTNLQLECLEFETSFGFFSPNYTEQITSSLLYNLKMGSFDQFLRVALKSLFQIFLSEIWSLSFMTEKS